ncbi:MAG: acyl-ACP--UDP-N-acetylglucosamine O-acyltransferase [Candidatus Brocadiales bacterium]|nr:acyl-ACP--UDP-N-acetylglucosamine O-acyltransferase [Candidatus Bathyanammoxibius amoris]
MNIHPAAQVHLKAELDGSVEVGAFSLIDEHVKIDNGTVIKNNVTVTGHTSIGKDNTVFPGTALGTEPQDLKHGGEDTRLEIGDRNVIRECVTINTGTAVGGGITRIGNDNLFMACAHIAHDCEIENGVLLANNVLLGGHVKVESNAKLMGLVGVQPFATIGQHAYVGGLTRIVQDVPPFTLVEGNPSRVRQINIVGLERVNFSQEQIKSIKEAFQKIFRQTEALDQSMVLDELEGQGGLSPEVKVLVGFMRNTMKGKFGRYLEILRNA